MNWFERLTGFEEESPQQVLENLEIEGTTITSKVNGRSMEAGQLLTPSLNQLNVEAARSGRDLEGSSSIHHIWDDVRALIVNPRNAGAVFQVASQFNLLEMASPNMTPANGIGIYQQDRTQGPACAIACGAGTIFRNYYATMFITDHEGKEHTVQMDMLRELNEVLGNPWKLANGYLSPTNTQSAEIDKILRTLNGRLLDHLRGLVRVGVQQGTEVTAGRHRHRVTQVFCSTVESPLIYHEELSRLLLRAAYEATVQVAVLNRIYTGNPKLFLTRIGGGAFNNDPVLIDEAIGYAVQQAKWAGLKIYIVGHE